jgi:mitogen-activated protein kinase kinase 3
VNSVEQKRLLMDLDISMRTADCPFTVQFYGALFREGDVWICMEVMDLSLDKFYPLVYQHGLIISENILQKISYAVSLAVIPDNGQIQDQNRIYCKGSKYRLKYCFF